MKKIKMRKIIQSLIFLSIFTGCVLNECEISEDLQPLVGNWSYIVYSDTGDYRYDFPLNSCRNVTIGEVDYEVLYGIKIGKYWTQKFVALLAEDYHEREYYGYKYFMLENEIKNSTGEVGYVTEFYFHLIDDNHIKGTRRWCCNPFTGEMSDWEIFEGERI